MSPADFLAAERLLLSPHNSEADLYAAMHAAAAGLVPTDAFYVCRVQRSPDWLHFVYNCEGDYFDKPEPFPFGKGPTSRVACEGCPVVMSRPQDREAFDLLPFADAMTITGSAVHWPLWVESEKNAPPDAVVSVQAYAPESYGRDALAAIEWLALRSAEAMRRQGAEERAQRAIEAAELAASRNRAIDDVRRFVAILDEVATLRHDPDRLLTEMRRRQVELTSWAPRCPVVHDALLDALSNLSDRELEVLVYVAQGLSNEEVAKILMCSRHTVKSHLDNVYRETPLSNRSQIAGAAAMIHVARVGR